MNIFNLFKKKVKLESKPVESTYILTEPKKSPDMTQEEFERICENASKDSNTVAAFYNGKVVNFSNGRNLYGSEAMVKRVIRRHFGDTTGKLTEQAIKDGKLVIKSI